MLLFKGLKNVPPSWGTEPSAHHPLPLSPHNHHLITEQGTSRCFLITLTPPLGRHLMMKNLLGEGWAFVALLHSSSFIISCLFYFCGDAVVCVSKQRGFSLHCSPHRFLCCPSHVFGWKAWNFLSWALVYCFCSPLPQLKLLMCLLTWFVRLPGLDL